MVTVEELEEFLEKCGYKLTSIIRLKNTDRLVIKKENGPTLVLSLRTKIDELTLRELAPLLLCDYRDL